MMNQYQNLIVTKMYTSFFGDILCFNIKNKYQGLKIIIISRLQKKGDLEFLWTSDIGQADHVELV